MELICGINPVLEALAASSRNFDRLLVVKGLRNKRVGEAMTRASRMGVPLRFESREALDRMSGGVPHQGLIAVVSPKPVLQLDELLDAARDPALLLLLDGVVDPRNLGAALRCADAAGADGVVLPERHSAGLSEVVSRASAGALEHVPVARVGNLAQAIEGLKERGMWIVGLDAEGHERWDSIDYKRPIAMVVGGEGRGIRRLVRERCDHLVSLPMFGRVESLNVSVAAGIALYEVVRQRGVVPSQVRPVRLAPAHPAPRIVGPDPADLEDDPGRLEPIAAAPASGDEDESLDAVPEPIHLVTLEDEDVAWGGGSAPEIVTVARRGRSNRTPSPGRRPKRGAPRRSGPGRRGGGAGPGGERPTPQAKDSAASEAATAAPDGQRRRRRRRRGSGRSAAGETPPTPESSEGAEAPAAAASGDGATAPRPRRRRRRKR